MLNDEYEILTIDDAMDYLMMGRNTLYKLLQSGELKGFLVGNKWRIPMKNIKEYIDRECVG